MKKNLLFTLRSVLCLVAVFAATDVFAVFPPPAPLGAPIGGLEVLIFGALGMGIHRIYKDSKRKKANK